jgi:myo-inositol catabolism protein IolS
MEYGKLGDLLVSRIAYGCWAMGGHGWGKVNDDDSIKAVHKALDLGINFFDTADVYGFGHSEVTLKKALGTKRQDVVIATKFGVTWDAQGKIGRNCSAKYMVSALENSLKRLDVECISLYQIHWPDAQVAIEETMDALQRAQQQGKIRYIGCSNFTGVEVKEASGFGGLNSVQAPYSLLDREIETEFVGNGIKNKMAVLSYGSLTKGLCSGKFTEHTVFEENDTRSKDPNFIGERFKKNLQIVEQLKHIGVKYNKSSAQVALRWVLDTPGITASIAGIKTAAQVEENSKALQWALSTEDYEFLSKYSCSKKLI